MNRIHPHLTLGRIAFMRDLAAMGVGEPRVHGSARNHLLKLGWIDGVYALPDGRLLSKDEFDNAIPRDQPGRWDGVKLAGVTLTDEGRRVLNEATDTGSMT